MYAGGDWEVVQFGPMVPDGSAYGFGSLYFIE